MVGGGWKEFWSSTENTVSSMGQSVCRRAMKQAFSQGTTTSKTDFRSSFRVTAIWLVYKAVGMSAGGRGQQGHQSISEALQPGVVGVGLETESGREGENQRWTRVGIFLLMPLLSQNEFPHIWPAVSWRTAKEVSHHSGKTCTVQRNKADKGNATLGLDSSKTIFQKYGLENKT